jgi:hypothetical protein
MSHKKYTLSHDFLLSSLIYDAETGLFTRKKSSRGAKIGDIAGWKEPDGYVRITFNGFRYCAHKLAWFYVTGAWPDEEIDHIDGVKSNNIYKNLRKANRSENRQNMRTASSRNKSGLLGVSTQKNGYISTICINGTSKYLGFYKTKEDAHAAYLKAKSDIHPFSTI